ncbi:acetyltransferase (GNAT) family protein [Flavobacterium sp. 103]|uniref:GNAT family N-acetyltransferase n=1 Tax=unclassified Flavobacterium TaxID=196869 RepID=UPI000D5E8FAF|nr:MULTISPECIES: GNAT family N-acetyltransferase [unclassified Flavobacterium]PVX45272.1 acetyltransferase (GNAT) family protein [Flavobacterium sp. 103]QKJ62576.1 GNAT family N-acetyltransferase [Flavobacterium sp. M31R6]
MQNIEKITDLETYSVRHAVLRKGKPIETCQFEGDALPSTRHFGYFLNNDLVGIISIFKNNNVIFAANNQYQIRGMAVLESHQKKGIGELLVKHCEVYCKKLQSDLIWFNARTVAVGFYEKLGYAKVGMAFEIKDVGEHYLMAKSIRNE